MKETSKWRREQSSHSYKGRTKYIGTHFVSIVSWSPAFSLITLLLKNGKEIPNVYVSGTAHRFLWDLVREQDGALYNEEITDEKNLWEVELSLIEHKGGPNHCGLELYWIDWLGGVKEKEEKPSTIGQTFIRWLKTLNS